MNNFVIIGRIEYALPTGQFLNNISNFFYRVGLPKEIKDEKTREKYEYEVFFDVATNGTMALHSYTVMNKSTGKKNVMLLSTLDPILGTAKGDDVALPAVIALYNFSKGGTDIGKKNIWHTLKIL